MGLAEPGRPTWKEAGDKGIVLDFSQASRDKPAMAKLSSRHALSFVQKHDIENAIPLLRNEWARPRPGRRQRSRGGSGTAPGRPQLSMRRSTVAYWLGSSCDVMWTVTGMDVPGGADESTCTTSCEPLTTDSSTIASP